MGTEKAKEMHQEAEEAADKIEVTITHIQKDESKYLLVFRKKALDNMSDYSRLSRLG